RPDDGAHASGGQRAAHPVDDERAVDPDLDAVNAESATHASAFRLASSSANTGAPMIAVTMPTGSSRGSKIVRAAVSAQIRKIAPTSATSGSSARWRGPTSSRTAWGRISPTNPIDPLTDTIAPVSRAVTASRLQRTPCTFTPRDAAEVSPKANASRVRPLRRIGMPAIRIAVNVIATAGQRAPASDPSSQLRISRYESPVTHQKMTRLVRADARADTAIPARTVRDGVMRPSELARASVKPRATSAPRNAASGRLLAAPSKSTLTAPSEAPDDSHNR